MKFRNQLILVASLAFAHAASAADIDSVANGDWTTGATWSDAAAPSAGNDYFVKEGFTVDSPVAGSGTSPGPVLTFGGDSLTVESGGMLRLRHTSDGGNNFIQYDLKTLTLGSGATLQSYNTARGNVTRRLNSDLVVAASGTVNIRVQSDSSSAWTNHLYLNGSLSGGADINLTGGLSGQSGDRRVFRVSSANNTYSGNWIVTGEGGDDSRRLFLEADAANALGTGTVTLNERAQLRVTANGSINSISSLTLNNATSTLQFLNAGGWNNSNASLLANNGTIELGTGASSIGTFTKDTSGTVTMNAGTGGSISAATFELKQGTLILNRSDDQTWNQQMFGAGSFAIQGGANLTLTSAQLYTGTTTVSDSTLTLSGTGGNRLATTSSLAFAGTSSLALGSNNQTVASLSLPVAAASSSTTITGSGTLTINGAAPFNFGVSGNIGTNVRTAAMDMTALAGFTFNSPTQVFRVGAQPGLSSSTGGRPDSSFLASNNTSITALSFLVGDQAGTGTGGNNTFRLGETTAINANTINIGASGRSNATLNFNTGLTAPEVTIRATNGSSRVTNWEVGRVAHFSNVSWNAIADFSGGEIDALVNNLRIGIINTTNQVNRQGVQNSTFTMGKGVLDVTNLVLGEQSGAYTNNTAGGTYAANGTFTLNHADGLLVANSIRLAENTGNLTGGTRSISGTLNLQAGTIEAAEIRLGDQTATSPAAITRNFNFSVGTVRNLAGSDLTITNVPINLTGTGTRIFEATTGRTITIASNAVISGSGQGFTKSGAGTMVIESNGTYTGATNVNQGTLLVNGDSSAATGTVTVASAATLGGIGTLGGDITVSGSIAPGNSIGTLNAGDNVTWNSGSSWKFELSSVDDTSDLLAITGQFIKGTGGTGSFVFDFMGSTPVWGETYTLATFGSLAGGFTEGDVTPFSHTNLGAGSYSTSYFTLTGTSLTFTAIPEPGTALAGLLLTAGLLRRRRKDEV
jgi:fibronectin-binding autotransporter adhesin